MQHMDLLCASDEASDLASFAQEFFSAIGVDGYEERESANYVGGGYYQATVGGVDLTVCLSDEEGFDDLPYWVHLDAEVGAGVIDLEGVVDGMVRGRLLANGFHVARIDNIGTYDAEGTRYKSAPAPSI